MVTPSGAITLTVIVFAPGLSATAPEAVPDVTAAPFTLMVSPVTAAAGVTVIDVVVLVTVAVYFTVAAANTGDNVPAAER